MRKLKSFLLLSVLSISSLSSFACGNEYARTEIPYYNKKLQLEVLLHRYRNIAPYWRNGNGEDVYSRYNHLLGVIRKADTLFKPYTDLTTETIQQLLTEVDYKVLSDYSWNALKMGDKKNALKLLEALYEKYPDEYNVVANLGTTYEVMGDNQKALTLLKKAVKINPKSHYGSEWIHINILEQKVSLTPNYQKILDLNIPNNFQEWLSGGKTFYKKDITPDSLMIQIAYQLHERISLIRPTDPIVGQLILDFADLVTISRPPYRAIEFYTYAAKYDPSLAFATKERIRMIQASSKGAKKTATKV